MQAIVGVAGFLILVWIFSAGSVQQKHDDLALRERQSQEYAEQQKRIERYSGEDKLQPRSATKRTAVRTAIPADISRLVAQVAKQYDVPAGALYGMWMKESAGLKSGWGDGQGWIRPLEMAIKGSECNQHYSVAWCAKQERALRAICNQRRGGQPICEPAAIRTSWALAMGPMQHLPTALVNEQDGQYVFAPHAADYDGDGVIDPHGLPDALASTAMFIKLRYRENGGSWQKACNTYFGSQKEGYFEGVLGNPVKGIVDYWRDWCAVPGNCADPAGQRVAKL